jgi:serine/threonine protein kinase
LFSNILALKIKWPKGFSGIAKDLISKLLKIEPKHRIPVNEITEHPWFKSVPQIRPVMMYTAP